jgi:primosomal protein N' (replication factor Y)
VYIDLIKKLAAQNKQVLFLLPEIALTAQLISRLRRWLGNIAVYHSKLSHAERVETWNKVQQNQIRIIVGARSALFLPFRDLGMIIVDEEHDPSYKQHDPAPRYQGRDTAIFLGGIYQANVLLGSATPSIESYFQAKSGKYGLATMNTRYGDAAMPEIGFVNIREAKKNKEYVSGLSFILRDAVQEALDKNQQIILFQNRRGYAPYLECSQCAWVPMCKNCDVTLTYHKYTNDLRCHYCGYTQSLIHSCIKCGSHEIEQKGLGTESEDRPHGL